MDSFDARGLALGTRVKYAHKVERKTDRSGRGLRKHWVRTETLYRDAWRTFPRGREGIIVGKRVYANGTISYDDYGPEFAADEHLTVYLVAWDMRKTPDPVLLEDLSFLEAESV